MKEAFDDLQGKGVLRKWGSALTDAVRRRNVFIGELRQVCARVVLEVVIKGNDKHVPGVLYRIC